MVTPSGERPSARAYAIVARSARVAVIFRRGPAKQVRMLRWDLATDEIEPGQWLSGRLYEERCDVSPDGRLVVYFAGKFKKAVDTFSAISRPPYFTALAFWPDSGTWGGGGMFVDDRRLALHYGRVDFEKDEGRRIPRDFEVVSYAEVRGTAADRGRHGFTLVQRGKDGSPTETMRVVYDEPWIEEKAAPGRRGVTLQRLWHGMFELNGPRCVYSYRLVTTGAPKKKGAPTVVDLGRLDWADWDHEGSLLTSARGCLHRRDVTRAFERPLAELPPPKLVADLTDMQFSAMPPPPEAREWPVRSGRRR